MSDSKADDGIFSTPRGVDSPIKLGGSDKTLSHTYLPDSGDIGVDCLSRKTPTETTNVILTVNRMYKEGRILTKEEAADELIQIRVPSSASTALAQVEFNARMTVNLGNYESVQLGVGIKLPCYVEEVNEAFATAKKIVDIKLNTEVDALREYKSKKA